ncbi:MAG: AsmA family protein [Acetobacteraceae bacterium]|nr:AsmA family protein [Acetobacteraceae bacterium]
MAQPGQQDGTVRRRGRGLRIAAIALAAVVVLVVGGGAILLASFDPNSLKPRIAAAVKQATGRDLALNGDIGLKWSLRPTVAVHGVAFANPPGFSRPQMATLQELDLQLALLPLMSKRVEIERLVLVHPDILLETDAQGHPNWQFTPEAKPAPASPSAGGGQGGSQGGTQIAVRDARIEDGTLAYRDGKSGQTTTLGIASLTGTADSPDSPLHVTSAASYNGNPFTLTADTGPMARLQDAAATTPWPVKLALQASSAKLAAEGTLTQPLLGKGYALTVDATAPDLMVLAPFFPKAKLPPLHDVSVSAKVADSGQPIPTVSALTLHIGATDLAAVEPGLALDKLDATAPALDQPVHVDLAGKRGGAAFSVVATSGAPARLMPGSSGAVPVDVTADAGGAHFAAKGSVANPEALTGVALDLSANVPDLSALSPLAQRPLPALKSVALTAKLTDADGGFAKGLALGGIVLTSAAGDVKGDLSVGFGGVPMQITAKLASDRIDVDALAAAQGKPLPAASGTPASPATPAPTPLPKRTGRLFSDQPIPFGLLQLVNADVAVTIGDLHAGGRDTKAINTHVVLRDGKLQADPLVADLPTGHLDAKLSADATQKAPPVGLVLRAPGVAVRTLLAMLGEPDLASGNLEVYADLHGAGETPHAIAASLDGTLGLAMANGSVDNRLLASVLGPVLEKANIPDLLARGGVSDIRCFALRMDAQHGVGTLRTLALSSTLLTMDGSGSVNLGDETLALHLRPQARVGGTGLIVPLRVTGPIRNPGVAMDPIGAAEANAGKVAGAVIGGATPLGLLGGMLGADKLTGGGGDACAGPLAVARGQPVPAAASGSSAPASGGQKPPNPAQMLRQLFR